MSEKKKIGTFKAFRNKNYALFFAGQSTSLIGTWMQRTAVAWVVYSITHSTFMLGLTVFAQQIPSSILSLYGGILSDRYDRYKILLITQTASMVQAILLAILVYTKTYTIWEILSLSVILGIINAFDVPARQPLVHVLIKDKDELPNALALNASMVNMARVVGPALSGIVLQKFGASICFLSNAASFVAVLSSLLLMRLPKYTPPSVKKTISHEMAEGFNYIKRTPIIKITLILLTLISLLVLPYDTMLPVFAKVVFKGDAATFGYIGSFMGLGAISGTLFLASLKAGVDRKVVLLANSVILGIGLIAFSHLNYFPIAMVFAIMTGFGSMSQNTLCITLLQVHSDKQMIGRVMSFMALAFFGMLPLGSLLIGVLSEHIGVQDTMMIQGIISLLIAITFSGYLRGDKLKNKDKQEFEETEATTLAQKV